MSDSRRGSEAGLPDEEDRSSGVRTFLIADVRGYTHFTQAHGDEAAAELAEAFASTTRAVAARCAGAVIELRGDEALVVFASARQALRAAVELQAEFSGASRDGPALPLGVGIGVDAGEAVPLEQGYRGGALNLAARLCANARAGEVLASEGVMHLSGRVQGLEFRDPVRLRVKGFPRPIRAYEVVSEGAARVKRRRRPSEVSARRRWTWMAASGALVAAAAGGLIFATSRPTSARALTRIAASSAGAIDPASNLLVDQVHVGAGPGRMAAGFRSLWVVNDFDSTVSRIDPASGSVEQVISVHGDPSAIAVGAGFVWVACSATRSVDRIDPRVNRRVQSVGVGNGPSGIAVTPGTVWVTNRLDDNVTEIDAKSGRVRRTRDAGPSPSDIAYGLGALWIANESSSTVTRLDPPTGGIEEIPVGNGPEAVAIGNGAVWVANTLDGTVSRIDPSRDAVANVITVGSGPSSVLASDGAIWSPTATTAASSGSIRPRISSRAGSTSGAARRVSRRSGTASG